MPKDIWTQAYTRGYYYGRSGREEISEADSCYTAHAGFVEGLAAGKDDFQNIDVAEQAAEAPKEPSEHID